MNRQETDRTESNRLSNGKRLLLLNAYIWFKKGRRFLPPVVRGVLGIIFILLGLLGFLPILGFWMIPLGIGLLATDIPPVARWFRKKIQQLR